MTLREQYKKETGYSAVIEYSSTKIFNGLCTQSYVHWIETKLEQLQNTSSNSDYAKCKDCGAPMNEGEAKTFTVCDDCWEKHFA